MPISRFTICAACWLVSISFLTVQSAQTPPLLSQEQLDQVTAKFNSGDPQQIAEAEQLIKPTIKAGKFPRELPKIWLPTLIKQKRYDDVLNITFDCITRKPDAATNYLRLRAEAQLAAGKPDQALATAKSYFNMCEMSRTPDALNLLELCLTRTLPDDSEIVQKFRAEQAAASQINSPSPANADGAISPTTSPSLTSPMLKAIHIDQTPYQG